MNQRNIHLLRDYIIVAAGLTGYGLLWYTTTFLVTLAVFLIHISINVDRVQRIDEANKDFMEAFLKHLK